jgi:hypothetical protein
MTNKMVKNEGPVTFGISFGSKKIWKHFEGKFNYPMVHCDPQVVIPFSPQGVEKQQILVPYLLLLYSF